MTKTALNWFLLAAAMIAIGLSVQRAPVCEGTGPPAFMIGGTKQYGC
jgi:hypothetical protein